MPVAGIMCHLLSVAVKKDYGRRGIGGCLTNLAIQNARNQGYHVCYSECSSAFSTKALTKHGMKSEKVIDYATFRISSNHGETWKNGD